MIESNDRFLMQLKEKEHTFLFNKNSVQDFLRRLGFESIRFEEQLFDYDMFFASSRQPFRELDRNEVEASLLATASGRMILALCDLEDRRQRENEQWQESERDRAARLEALLSADEIIKARDRHIQELKQAINQLSKENIQLRQENILDFLRRRAQQVRERL